MADGLYFYSDEPDPVNFPPTTLDDGPFSTLNNSPLTITPLDNDTDDQNQIDPSSVVFYVGGVAQSNPYTNAGGTWSVNGSGVVTFTPNGSFVGQASVDYCVSDLDGLMSNISTITVNVTEPPVAAVCPCNHPGIDNDCCSHIGQPLGMDGPGNITLRNIDTKLAQPFCARSTGSITHYSVNLKYATARPNYSAGDLGDIQTCVYEADANGDPFGPPLGCHVVFDPLSGGDGPNDGGNLGKWAFATPIPVVAGQNYALVHNNIGNNPSANFCSINLGRDFPHGNVNPPFAYREYATGNFFFQPRLQGPATSWSPNTPAPGWWTGDPNAAPNVVNGRLYWHDCCFAVYLDNGDRMGNDYVGGRFGDETAMSNSTWVRTYFETIAPKEATHLNFKTTFNNPTGTVTGRVYDGGTLLTTVTLSPNGPYWFRGALSTPLIFNPGTAYDVRWSSSATHSIRPVHTALNGHGWAEDTANPDNHLAGHGFQRSFNSGGSWQTPAAGNVSTVGGWFFETTCLGGGSLSFTEPVGTESTTAGGDVTFSWTGASSDGCSPITSTIETQAAGGGTWFTQGTTQANPGSWTFSNIQPGDDGVKIRVTLSCGGNSQAIDIGEIDVTGSGGLPLNANVYFQGHSLLGQGTAPQFSFDSTPGVPGGNTPGPALLNAMSGVNLNVQGVFSNPGANVFTLHNDIIANQAAWQGADAIVLDSIINGDESAAAFQAEATIISNYIKAQSPGILVVWVEGHACDTAPPGSQPNVQARWMNKNPTLQTMSTNGIIDGVVPWANYAAANPGVYSANDCVHHWFGTQDQYANQIAAYLNSL